MNKKLPIFIILILAVLSIASTLKIASDFQANKYEAVAADDTTVNVTIDGSNGNITLSGTVDGVDIAALASANTGDQTSIVGIAGTKAQFDTAVSDSNFLYVDGSSALTANWDIGSFSLTALTFTSDQATGTAPFTVASTTVVTNLNADTVDGVSVSGSNTGDDTFGIANTNAVDIDSASVASGEYAKFTANGLESKSFTEVKTDLSLNLVENTALTTFTGSSNITILGTIATGVFQGTPIATAFIADNSITLAKQEHGTAGDIFYYGACGVPTRLAKGCDGQHLELVSGIPDWVAPAGGGVTILQVRRTCTQALSGCMTNITFDTTNFETCAAIIEHCNTCTHIINLKVNGNYLLTVNGQVEGAAQDESRKYGFRAIQNGCAIIVGSNWASIPIENFVGGCGSPRANAGVHTSFYVSVTCAPETVIFQMDETSGNVELIEGLTLRAETR